ncbi:hypothetical protein D9M70_356270 [compost metagenome]
MTRNFSPIEWEGLLRGRAMPGDILVNESMANYLHRRVQKIVDERDDLRSQVDLGEGRRLFALCAEHGAPPGGTLKRLREKLEAPQRWIPVSERLPTEEDGTVAVLTEAGSILTAWATYWHGARSDFAGWTFPHPGDEEEEKVVFWAPLPAQEVAHV